MNCQLAPPFIKRLIQLVSGSLSWSSPSTKTTVIKQDGDNKVSNRDFSLGLNVGATIAFNYYF